MNIKNTTLLGAFLLVLFQGCASTSSPLNTKEEQIVMLHISQMGDLYEISSIVTSDGLPPGEISSLCFNPKLVPCWIYSWRITYPGAFDGAYDMQEETGHIEKLVEKDGKIFADIPNKGLVLLSDDTDAFVLVDGKVKKK